MKFINWIKKHIVASVAIVVFTIAIAVSGILVLSSRIGYVQYETNYYQDILDVKANNDPNPSDVTVDTEFALYKENGEVELTKSAYSNSFSIFAKDVAYVSEDGKTDKLLGEGLLNQYLGGMNEEGGKITITFEMSKPAYLDIDLVMASSMQGKKAGEVVETKDLLEKVSVKINKAEMEGEAVLDVNKPGLNWRHLVMESVVLNKGVNTITISSNGNNPNNASYKVMPYFRNASFFTEATVTFPKA